MSVKYRHAFRKTLCGTILNNDKRNNLNNTTLNKDNNLNESIYHDNDSPRWLKKVSKGRRKPSTDLVVVIDSGSSWRSTLLKLTMQNDSSSNVNNDCHDKEQSQHSKVCIKMETCI